MAGYIGSKASVVSSGAERKTVITATAGQTSLTGLSYTPTQVHVFQNGVRLVDGTDYTATNGSSITLTVGASADDQIVVVSYATYQNADSYTKAEADARFVNDTGDTVTFTSNEGDALLIEQADGTDVGSLRINNGSFILKGKNSSQPVQIQTHDGNEDIEVDPDGFIKFETGGSERMRITSGGDLVVGDAAEIRGSSQDGVSVEPEGRLHISRGTGTGGFGHLVFYNGNGQVGTVTTSGSSTAYNTSSDYRLKENVTNVTDGITRVKQLAPKRFNFISDPDTTVDGFIAHEAQAVVPEAITGTHNEVDDDGNAVMQSIDQSKLVPLLTAALQEAITEIETLKTKVAALEAG